MKFGKLLKFTIPAVLFLAITGQWYNAYTSASGPDPGYTDAPGENGNCTSCHSGTATTSSSAIKLKTHQSSTTLEYLPDSTYTITIDFSPSSGSRYGFQTTALINSNSRMAGTFNITNSSTTKSASATFSSNTRYYVEQTSSGTSTKSWSFEWKAPSSNVGDITFYVAANAANNNSSTSGDAIHTNSFKFTPSSKLPTASIVSPSSSLTICAGDSVNFNASGTNSPTSYKWTLSGGTPSTSTAQKPTVKYFSPGTYTARLSVSNAYGTSTEVTRQIIVRALPADSITVGGPKTFCEGDSVKLTAPATGIKFEWSTGATTSVIYAKSTGNYTVKATNANNCSVITKPVAINVISKPNVTLSRIYGTDEICNNDSLTFEASAGHSSYTFYNGKNILQTGASNIFTARSLSTGIHSFYVIATNSNGCKSDTSGKINATVAAPLPAPQLNCGGSTTSSATISWNTVNGADGYEVSTDGGSNWAKTTSETFTATGLQADETVTFQVRATDNTICKNGNIATLACKSLPCSELTYTIEYKNVVCEGDNAVINFGKLSSPTYAITLNGGAPTKDTIFTIPLTGDAELTFNLYDSTKLNCDPITEKLNIRYNLLPAIQLLETPAACMGDEVTLTATDGYDKYSFYKNGILLNTSASRTYSSTGFSNKDKVYVIGETALGCSKQSAEDILTISKRTNPGFTYTSNTLTISFSDTTRDVGIRRWDFGDNNSSILQNPTHTYAAPGQYTVWLFTANAAGCIDSVSKTLDVKSVGIQELFYLQDASVYPNPAKTEVNILLLAKQASKVQVTLTDLRGKTVVNMPVQAKQGKNHLSLPVSNLAGGTYILRIQTGNEIITRKVMKLKER